MLACLDEALRIFPSIPLSLNRQTLLGAPTPVAGMMIPEPKSASTNSQPSTPSATFTAPKNSSPNAGSPKAQTTLPHRSITTDERSISRSVSDPEIVLGGIWHTMRCGLLWRDCCGILICGWMSRVTIGMSRRFLDFGRSRL